MIWLLHPTHRKFIKLLKNYIKKKGFIYITTNDIEEYKNIFTATNMSVERHQRVYRIFLKAINRTQVEQNDVAGVVTLENIGKIESILRGIELSNPLVTFRNAVIYPILTSVLRYLLRRYP